MKKIGIYPGNFQPASMAHFEVYKKLKALIGGEGDVFVATTDRDPTPDAPLNFGDKSQIWVKYGVPIHRIIKVNSLPSDNAEKAMTWHPKEIYEKFSSSHTSAIIAVNEMEYSFFSKRKGMKTNHGGLSAGGLSDKTRNEIKEIFEELGGLTEYVDGLEKKKNIENKDVWIGTDGAPQYFQPYIGNEHDLKSFEEHAYVVVIDDTRINGNPISTSNIRRVLGSKRYNDNQKKKFFWFVFGWFDQGLYQLMIEKFRHAFQVSANPEEKPIANPTINTNKIVGKRLGEVVEVLKGLSEDYASSIATADSTDSTSSTATDAASTLDNTTNQNVNAAKQTADLNKQKRELEAKAKQNKQQRDNYATTVRNYDTFQRKTDRSAIDAVNTQLSHPIQPTPPTP